MSEATVRYTSSLGPYLEDRFPNLATVVIHDGKLYRSTEWKWYRKDWVRALNGTIEEKIKIGRRKVEGCSHKKASSITVTGNISDPNSTTKIHPNISVKLCPTAEWKCNKQNSLVLCYCQKYIGNYTPLDSSTNNIEITESCENEETVWWYNFTLTRKSLTQVSRELRTSVGVKDVNVG